MGIENVKKYLLLSECKDGFVYFILARNAHIGIFNEKKKTFVISRHKFGDNFLFEEDHWDTGEPYGTVKPIRLIEKFEERDEEETLKYLNSLSEKYPDFAMDDGPNDFSEFSTYCRYCGAEAYGECLEKCNHESSCWLFKKRKNNAQR